jgi:putative transposase
VPLFHVWFSTKRRQQLLEGDLEELAERFIREAAASERIRLIECKAILDHVHTLIELESAELLPRAMKAIKGKSARWVFREMPELKLDAHTAHLWQRGYGWKIVPRGAEPIVRRYIRTQWDRLESFER